MNSLVSLAWLKEFVDVKCTIEELARRLSLVGVGVEHIIKTGHELDGIIVGRVESIEKHPNADSLHVCRVNIGPRVVTIVCGGVNLRVGMLVAVALPGSHVHWHGEQNKILIETTTLRGVKSEGMICASDEICLGDILSAPEKHILDVGALSHAKSGAPLADALGLDDIVFEIEATTNRPDFMSVIGVGREVVAGRAGIFKKIKSAVLPKISAKKIGAKLSVKILDKKLCQRYMAARIDGVVVGESPWWVKRRLFAAGVRPINNIVDITNYVRLEFGQPMHAFDANKIIGGIAVRRACVDETLKALDGITYKLNDSMLVIADNSKPLAISGVMGGQESGVTSATTSIIFEAATFDPVSIRKTSRALGLYSDSQLLFEKGLSVEAPTIALARAVELCLKIIGGELIATADQKIASYKAPVFPFDFTVVESFVGEKIPVKEMKRILTSLGFAIAGTDKKAKITVPWWRDHDIESPVDFIEEITRVYGYGNLPSVLPYGSRPNRSPQNIFVAERALREHFVGQGFNEITTYSFTNFDELSDAGMEKLPVMKLLNPLNADLTHMRPSLLPKILSVIRENESHEAEGRIFEVSNVYIPREGETPIEQLHIAAAVWSPAKNGESFFALKGSVEAVLVRWGILDAFDFHREEHSLQWHPGRTLVVKHDGHTIGVIGEIHPLVAKRFGIAGRATVFMAGIEALWKARPHTTRFTQVPEFPPAKRDIAFVVDESVRYHDISEFFASFDPLLAHAELFDLYRGNKIEEGNKSMAFHLHYSAKDRTLTNEEVGILHKKLSDALKKQFGAKVRE